MHSPRQTLANAIMEVWPGRAGMAANIAASMPCRLSEAGCTIACECGEVTEAKPLDDAPLTADGSAFEEQVAGACDFELALAAYDAAVKCWPKAAVTLRQGSRALREGPTAGHYRG